MCKLHKIQAPNKINSHDRDYKTMLSVLLVIVALFVSKNGISFVWVNWDIYMNIYSVMYHTFMRKEGHVIFVHIWVYPTEMHFKTRCPT